MLQTPLHEYIGMNGCQFYNAVVLAHGHWLLIGGFEMALFRLLCLIGKSTKYLYHLGILLEVGQVTLALIATSNIGWETSLSFQYCMNYGTELAQAIQLQNVDRLENDSKILFDVIRLSVVISAQLLVVIEFLIYLYIIYHLIKHDKIHYSEGIITITMKRTRYTKNMINLKGQMIVFLSKIAITICIFIYIASGTFSEPSFTSPILIFIPPTIISLSQLYTSHDIKLYLRMKLQN